MAKTREFRGPLRVLSYPCVIYLRGTRLTNLLLTLRRCQRELHGLTVMLPESDRLRFGRNRWRLWRNRRQLGGDPVFARRKRVEGEVAVLIGDRAGRARSVVERFRVGSCPNLRRLPVGLAG
jgi:hypothetical protein